MNIKKSEVKYTKPFTGKKDVIVMLVIADGQTIASCAPLDYDAVHALEKLIVDCTFVDD